MIPNKSTLLKITMEHNNEGLEDDVPFQLGDLYDFVCSMLIFQGVTKDTPTFHLFGFPS